MTDNFGVHFLHKQKSGAFTLTEMAIVVGIIGGLVGVVWATASDVNINRHVSEANGQLTTIVNNIRIAYAEQAGISNGGSVAALTTALDRLKIFPLAMRDPNGSTGTIWHSWNAVAGPSGLGNIEVTASQCSVAGGGQPASVTSSESCFGVSWYNLSQKPCVQFLVGAITTGTSLQQIFVNGANVTFPTDAGTAAAACGNAGANVIEFVYLIKGTTQ